MHDLEAKHDTDNSTSMLSRLLSEQALTGFIQFIARQLFTLNAARFTLLILLIAFAAIAYVNPLYGWDALAYMAVAVEDNFTTPTELHKFIFDSVKQTVTPDGWHRLAHYEAYHEAQFASADNFSSMLGFYRMRIAYIALVALVAKITGIVYAPWILGAAFGLASLILFYATFRKIGMERYFVLTIPLILAADLPRLIQLPTPDSMSCFFLLLGWYIYIFHNRPIGYAAWGLAVLTRPDNLVFLVALLIVQVMRRDSKIWDWAGLMLGTVCYVLAVSHTGHMGWWTHFYFTNIALSMNMNEFNVPFSIKLYLGAVLYAAVKTIYMASWFHMYLMTLLGYAFLIARKTASSLANQSFGIWDGIIITTIIAISARLIVFPHMAGRIMAPMVLLAGLALATKLRDQWQVTDNPLIH